MTTQELKTQEINHIIDTSVSKPESIARIMEYGYIKNYEAAEVYYKYYRRRRV